MECDYSMLWIFSLSLSLYSDFFPTHINSVFSPRLLLFCKKKTQQNKAVTRFSSLVGRSSSPSSILPPPIWHCGRRIRRRGEKRNVPARMTRSKPDQRRWSFCESVTAGVREYVKEGKKRGREGGRRCSWMGRRMTGGGFTLQVMCGFKIQLFLYIYKPLFILYFICELLLHRLFKCNWRQADEGGRRSKESRVWTSHLSDEHKEFPPVFYIFTMFKQSLQSEVKQPKPLMSLLISEYWTFV